VDDYPLIELQSVSFSYGQQGKSAVPALDRVSLCIAEGEFVAILGANGSGKSTLAKHMNALLLPSDGKVNICGLDSSDPENLLSIRRQVSMVFQNPDNQIVATVVEEDVAFGPENLGLSREEIENRVATALRTVGMEEYRHHAPHLLSGGQKQRVAIAGAIAMHPRVLVCDEATAMLDPAGRVEILSSLHQLHKDGMTIVLVTHDTREALMADRVVLLKNGGLVAQGKPKNVFIQEPLMRDLGLGFPPFAQIAAKLYAKGLISRADILTADDMLEVIRESIPGC